MSGQLTAQNLAVHEDGDSCIPSATHDKSADVVVGEAVAAVRGGASKCHPARLAPGVRVRRARGLRGDGLNRGSSLLCRFSNATNQ